jgi:hypothetical protein
VKEGKTQGAKRDVERGGAPVRILVTSNRNNRDNHFPMDGLGDV